MKKPGALVALPSSLLPLLPVQLIHVVPSEDIFLSPPLSSVTHELFRVPGVVATSYSKTIQYVVFAETENDLDGLN